MESRAISQGEVNPPGSGYPPARRIRSEFPLILALLAVGCVLSGLLVGYEPVGGDPDRLYRPLKSELARALSAGRLPFWSERFALGVPLVAESHVAAFYPPNLVAYRVLDISSAYRLSMWLHYVALAASTYFYARCVGVRPWGSALAALAFTLCGFMTVHSSHEPFYLLMPYLPLALALAERLMATGRIVWLTLLTLALGFQWTLGHFQIQTWTTGLVAATGLWRAAVERRPWARAAFVIAGACLGSALAAVQLGLSWQYARHVGQTERDVAARLFYSFPPAHWFELAVPRPLRELRLGPEDPYWYGQQTTGYEAALYIGTVPLIFAVISFFARPASHGTLPLRLLVLASFALATMPRWWSWGYVQFLALPGLGYFRVPARYTLLTSLGMAVLAGEGFDRSISPARFRFGLAGAALFAASAGRAALLWSGRENVQLRSFFLGIPQGILWGLLAWAVSIVVVLGWRSGRLGSWAPVAAAAVELGILFHLGTTHWGWSIALPDRSPVLSELAHLPGTKLVGGELENLPLRAGLGTGYPYLGFAHPMPTSLLQQAQWPLVMPGSSVSTLSSSDAVQIQRWMRRFRVTHMAGHHRALPLLGKKLGTWRDPALDQIVFHPPQEPEARLWAIVELEEPAPEARVATRARTVADGRTLIERLAVAGDLDPVWFLEADQVPPRPDGRAARLVSWNGSAAVVEHDGPCDLVLARTYDAGWLARVDDGPEQPVLPADGGFQAVRLYGSGTQRVTVRYQPHRILLWAAISLLAVIIELGLVLASAAHLLRKPNGAGATFRG
jgi:hypothetical protein